MSHENHVKNWLCIFIFTSLIPLNRLKSHIDIPLKSHLDIPSEINSCPSKKTRCPSARQLRKQVNGLGDAIALDAIPRFLRNGGEITPFTERPNQASAVSAVKPCFDQSYWVLGGYPSVDQDPGIRNVNFGSPTFLLQNKVKYHDG